MDFARYCAKVVLWITVVATMIYLSVSTPWTSPQSTVVNEGELVHNSALCRQKSPDLLVLVTSPPNNRAQREAIRSTWGAASLRSDIVVGFILDSNKYSLLESNLYSDMVVGRIYPLFWAASFCRHAKFVLVVRDNAFVNVPKLLSFVHKHYNISETFYGNRNRILVTGDALPLLKTADILQTVGVNMETLDGLLDDTIPTDACGVLNIYVLGGVEVQNQYQYWRAVSDPEQCNT